MIKHLNISEAAKVLGVTKKTLQNWDKENKLSPYKNDNGYRFYCSKGLEEYKKTKSYTDYYSLIKKCAECLVKNQKNYLEFVVLSSNKSNTEKHDLSEGNPRHPAAIEFLNDILDEDFFIEMFSSLKSIDLFSVQPLTGPTGLVFNLALKNTDTHELIIDRFAMTAQTSKFKSTWSKEAAYDLQAISGPGAKDELKSMLAANLAAELDQECIDEIISKVNHIDVDFAQSKLDMKIHELANNILEKTKRLSAKWVIVNHEIYNLISRLGQFTKTEDENTDCDFIKIKKMGTLDHLDIYLNHSIPKNKMIIGAKTASYLDSGLILSPYMFLAEFSLVGFLPRIDIKYRGNKLITSADSFMVINTRNLISEEITEEPIIVSIEKQYILSLLDNLKSKLMKTDKSQEYIEGIIKGIELAL